jgi:Icc-related predicted phosphoesterase
VDGIVVSGDLILNEELRYGRPDEVEDAQELEGVLDHLERAGIPVWVIPGNHEEQSIYEEAFSKKRSNVLDLAKFRRVDLNGINIVSLPGYYLKKQGPYLFLPEKGFFLSETEIRDLPEKISRFKDADPILVITHGPPQSIIENGVDVVPGVGHTGSEVLRKVLLENNVSFIVFGHIHEGGPQGENGTEKIREGFWTDRLWLNAGAAVEGHGAQMELEGSRARWNQIRR